MAALMPMQLDKITLEEAVELGAVDDAFFGRFFFPRAYRQDSPGFHKRMDNALNDPDHQYVSMMVFRGAAKTTKVRTYLARRIAYGISRTILVVGKSQDAAARTVTWIKNAVVNNRKYASCFKLKQGNKWTEVDIEITHEAFLDENGGPLTIRVLAFGMTGSIRGVNIEDCRPDLIIVDDPCDDENTKTPEQRDKMNDLFFGALQKTLAPRTEAPQSKMILLQTVLHSEDLVSLCEKDSTWHSLRISCFDENGESVWPSRFPTKTLLADKQAHIDRGQLSLWMKEMECQVIAPGLCAFAMDKIQFWEILPEGGVTFLCCDPTPPPKDSSAPKPGKNLDDCVLMVIRVMDQRIYVADYYICKSPDPDELFNQLFTMVSQWKIKDFYIETILFARVLKWALEKEMQRRRTWLTVHPVEDKRHKEVRIRQEISARTSNRNLYVHKSMTALLDQYLMYPKVSHDDILDCLAIGLMSVQPWMMSTNIIEGEYTVETDEPLALDWRAAP